MTTVAQAFQSMGLVQWWNNVTNPWNGGLEKGTDFGLGGFDKPVGSLTPGKVVYVGDGGYPGSSIGQIVQIVAPDGRLFHYQHLKTANVSVGQQVKVGSPVGSSGGCPVGAYGNGNACTWYDTFSTGQHIEVRTAPSYNPSLGVWSQAWQSPMSVFTAIANGDATNVATGGVTNTSGAGPNPNCGVDPICYLNNWWTYTVAPTLIVWFEYIAIFIIALLLIIVGVVLLGGGEAMKAVAGKAVSG